MQQLTVCQLSLRHDAELCRVSSAQLHGIQRVMICCRDSRHNDEAEATAHLDLVGFAGGEALPGRLRRVALRRLLAGKHFGLQPHHSTGSQQGAAMQLS